jgi:hypothetical protein
MGDAIHVIQRNLASGGGMEKRSQNGWPLVRLLTGCIHLITYELVLAWATFDTHRSGALST